MNLLRSVTRRPTHPTKVAEEPPLLGYMLYGNGRVEAIKQGSGWFGSGLGDGFGDGAFSETAIGVGMALSQSNWGWAAAYSVSTWVYRCIELRKAKIHAMPWKIVNRRTKVPIPQHPLEIALKRNRQKLFKKIEQSQLLFGETFLEFADNDYRYTSDLFWLNNLGMAVLVGAGRIMGYSYTAVQGGTGRNFTPEQVAFMKTDNPFNDLRGMSPTEVIMDEVGIDKSVAQVVRAYYANNTRVGMIFIPKTNLTTSDAERFMEMWTQQHQGPKKAGKPSLVPFDMTVERVQEPITVDDVQARESVRREIAAGYGVPLSMAGAWDDANYQSLPEQRKSFYEETIIPECDNIAEFINEDLLPVFDDSGSAEFKYDYDQILALTEDAQKKNDIFSNRLLAGGITRAEFRQALNHPVDPDGADDVYYIPTGVTIVPAHEIALVTPSTNEVEQTPQQQAAPEPSSIPPSLPSPNDKNPTNLQLPPPAQQAPKQLPAPKPTQATPESELAAWERKALNSNPVKASDSFVCYVTPKPIAYMVHEELFNLGKDATKAQIRGVFAAAKAALLTPPAAPYDYWKRHDALMDAVGHAWLRDYMARALPAILATNGLPSGADVQPALDAVHPALTQALLGTEEAPGPLVKLVEAGMAAGQEALHGAAANPTRPVTRKALAVDWNLLAVEARDFAKQYLFDLIKRVDDTTRSAVSDAVTKWIESGEPLDSLKQALTNIFQDEARAQLIAQTESTRAYAEGSKDRYRRADVKLVKLMTTNDGHVCKEICEPAVKLGAVSMDEGFPTKDGRGIPPLHPGCRCWLKPVVED